MLVAIATEAIFDDSDDPGLYVGFVDGVIDLLARHDDHDQPPNRE